MKFEPEFLAMDAGMTWGQVFASQDHAAAIARTAAFQKAMWLNGDREHRLAWARARREERARKADFDRAFKPADALIAELESPR